MKILVASNKVDSLASSISTPNNFCLNGISTPFSNFLISLSLKPKSLPSARPSLSQSFKGFTTPSVVRLRNLALAAAIRPWTESSSSGFSSLPNTLVRDRILLRLSSSAILSSSLLRIIDWSLPLNFNLSSNAFFMRCDSNLCFLNVSSKAYCSFCVILPNIFLNSFVVSSSSNAILLRLVLDELLIRDISCRPERIFSFMSLSRFSCEAKSVSVSRPNPKVLPSEILSASAFKSATIF